MILYARTQPGLQKSANEDCTLINDNVISYGNYCKLCDGRNFLAAVADGVGGQSGARIASNYILNALCEEYKNNGTKFLNSDSQDNCEYIYSFLADINKNLIEYSSELEDMKNMASTLTGIIAVNDSQYAFHMGNTRIYSYKDGMVSQITKDHTTVNQMIEDGQLSEEDAIFFKTKNEINCCMGGGDERLLDRIEVNDISDVFNNNNLVFITSDGIHDYLENGFISYTFEKIIDEYGINGLVSGFTVDSDYTNDRTSDYINIFELIINCLDNIALRLIDEAHYRGSMDDTSIVILLK